MADRKYVVDINLNQNELQNAVMQNLSTAPANPKAGQHYYNTADNTEYVWNGTKWVDALSQGDYVFEDGITEGENRHVTLDIATTSSIGGVIVGSNINVDSSTGTISVNDASTSQKGVIEIATDAEATAGTAETLAVNPKQLKSAITGKITLSDLSIDSGSTNYLAYDNTNGKFSAKVDTTVGTISTNLITSGAVQTGLDTKVTKNADITAGTHTKITYDAKGLVTAGTDIVLADVTDVTASATEVNYLDGVTSNVQTQIDSKLAIADIINNVATTTTNQALSANMGKELQDQIDNLKSIGRYLSNWNCTTGLPTTDPTVSPYTYHTGDYYLVGTVAAEGGTNYKPDGSSYTIGVASTVEETREVKVGDIYMYDSTVWQLLSNTEKTVTFDSIAGNPYDNTNLATALNAKVTGNSLITAGTKCKITYDAKGLVTAGADLEFADIPDLSSTYVTLTGTQTITNKTINANDNTITNLATSNFASGVIQTTLRSSALASDTAIASEKAVATAVEAVASAAVHKLVVSNPAITSAAGICTWEITNTLSSDDVSITIKEIATGEEVYCENTYGTGKVTVKMNSTSNIAANTYKAIIMG